MNRERRWQRSCCEHFCRNKIVEEVTIFRWCDSSHGITLWCFETTIDKARLTDIFVKEKNSKINTALIDCNIYIENEAVVKNKQFD